MKIEKTYTENAFRQAVEIAKAEGHIFKGYTWNAACFSNLLIVRNFE